MSFSSLKSRPSPGLCILTYWIHVDRPRKQRVRPGPVEGLQHAREKQEPSLNRSAAPSWSVDTWHHLFLHGRFSVKPANSTRVKTVVETTPQFLCAVGWALHLSNPCFLDPENRTVLLQACVERLMGPKGTSSGHLVHVLHKSWLLLFLESQMLSV